MIGFRLVERNATLMHENSEEAVFVYFMLRSGTLFARHKASKRSMWFTRALSARVTFRCCFAVAIISAYHRGKAWASDLQSQ